MLLSGLTPVIYVRLMVAHNAHRHRSDVAAGRHANRKSNARTASQNRGLAARTVSILNMAIPGERIGIALGCAGVLLFAGTLPATRLAVGSIDPLFLTAARTTIAGCAGLTLLLLFRRPLPPRALWGRLIAAALCSVIGFPVLMALAMTTVPAAHGGVVLGIIPLATTAAACVVAAERPSAGFWLVSLAGAAIVIVFVLSQGDTWAIAPGDLFLLGTVAAGSFAYALSGRLSLTIPGWEVISWQVTALLPLSVVAMLALWPHGLANGAGVSLGRAGLCQFRQPVPCVLCVQRRDGDGRRRRASDN